MLRFSPCLLARLLAFGISSLSCFSAWAQFFEFGGSLGGFNYRGDADSYVGFQTPSLAGSGLVRMNFSNTTSFRVGLAAGGLRGRDHQETDILSQRRQTSFNNQIIELSGVFEYYFLDFREHNIRIPFSPYIFGGVGGFYYLAEKAITEQYSLFQPVFPVGLGVCYLLGKQLNMGVELGLRQTFFDQLDGVAGGDVDVKDYKYGDRFNYDSYHYLGLSLSYILYQIKCPYRHIPRVPEDIR